MGNLRACFAVAMLALAACGSDHATPDASIKLIDAPPVDMKVWEDAPPPTYDLSCLNGTPPSTAPGMITVSGATQTFAGGGGSSVADVPVDVFENGNATALKSTTSDATGAFTLSDIPTGDEPIDGYIRAGKATYRTTYMYPPSVVATDLADVPVIMISNATFQMFEPIAQQDDTVNGAILLAVTDCNNTQQTLVPEATVAVEQNGASVGTTFGLGAVIAQLAGTYIVLNVPDGDVEIKVSYDGMNWPVRTVRAYKKPMGQNEEGTLTFTAVRPGP